MKESKEKSHRNVIEVHLPISSRSIIFTYPVVAMNTQSSHEVGVTYRLRDDPFYSSLRYVVPSSSVRRMARVHEKYGDVQRWMLDPNLRFYKFGDEPQYLDVFGPLLLAREASEMMKAFLPQETEKRTMFERRVLEELEGIEELYDQKLQELFQTDPNGSRNAKEVLREFAMQKDVR